MESRFSLRLAISVLRVTLCLEAAAAAAAAAAKKAAQEEAAKKAAEARMKAEKGMEKVVEFRIVVWCVYHLSYSCHRVFRSCHGKESQGGSAKEA